MFEINDMPGQVSESLIKELANLETGTIGHFLDEGFMDSGIEAKMPKFRIAGTAVTVRSPFPDSVIGHYALKNIRPGDILIIDRGGDQTAACWGGTTSFGAVKMGLSGLIIDGAGNDISQSEAYGLPIWCRGVTPVTTKYRGLGGSLNTTITCGGVVVNPGDAVLADENGVLVIPVSKLEEVIEMGNKFAEMEKNAIAKMNEKDDLNYPDLTGASAIVKAALAGEPLPLDSAITKKM